MRVNRITSQVENDMSDPIGLRWIESESWQPETDRNFACVRRSDVSKSPIGFRAPGFRLNPIEFARFSSGSDEFRFTPTMDPIGIPRNRKSETSTWVDLDFLPLTIDTKLFPQNLISIRSQFTNQTLNQTDLTFKLPIPSYACNIF